MKRSEFLDQVKEIVCCSRQDQHGNPENTFERIGELWTGYMRARWGAVAIVAPTDVANMMVLFKVARAIGNPGNLENYLDMAGYAANAAEIVSQGE